MCNYRYLLCSSQLICKHCKAIIYTARLTNKHWWMCGNCVSRTLVLSEFYCRPHFYFLYASPWRRLRTRGVLTASEPVAYRLVPIIITLAVLSYLSAMRASRRIVMTVEHILEHRELNRFGRNLADGWQIRIDWSCSILIHSSIHPSIRQAFSRGESADSCPSPKFMSLRPFLHEFPARIHDLVSTRPFTPGSRMRSVRILFFERYVRTLTYSILAYVNKNRGL